jgi:hypothetical protein
MPTLGGEGGTWGAFRLNKNTVCGSGMSSGKMERYSVQAL